MLKPLSNIIKEVNISRIFESINILSDIDDTDELIAFIMLPEAESVIAGETFQFNPQSISLQLI